MGTIRIGISGWRYDPWRGQFYPESMVQRRELEFASRALSTIEINGSFYSLQRPESYANWYEETPPGFVFSVKGPKFITHIRRLREVETALANFFASGVLRLNEKLGPFLWQLPPNFKFDPAIIEPFLAGLPHDTEHALHLAKQHDAKVEGRSWLEIDGVRPLRHAMEVRNETFVDPDFIALLRQYNVAFVVADTAGRWPEFDDVSSDFVYMRLHGATELYRSGYDEAEIDRWAARAKAWSEGGQPEVPHLMSPERPPPLPSRDVFCYFDNTDKLHAPVNAARMLTKLGLPNGLQADGRFKPLDEAPPVAKAKRAPKRAAAVDTPSAVEPARGRAPRPPRPSLR